MPYVEHSKPVLDFRLPADVRAPKMARGRLAALAGDIDPSELQDLELSISELVTNSIRHGGLLPADRVSVRVWVGKHVLRAQVRDPGRSFPAPPVGRDDGGGGWGLRILDALTRKWGIERDGETTVWLEMDRPSHAA